MNTQTQKSRGDLMGEINEKVVVLNGRPDMVLIPLFLWERVAHQLENNSQALSQREAEVREEIENIFTPLEGKHEEFYAGYSQAKYEILSQLKNHEK